MKESDVKKLNLVNEDSARLFIQIDDAIEAETGQSMLGKTKPFLMNILTDAEGSNIPGAFSALLNSRLTGKTKSALIK